MALQFACERIVDVEDLTCDCDLPADLDIINNVLDGASDFLTLLAGVQIGRCSAAYRPCRDKFLCYPVSRCGCHGLTGVHLPGTEPEVTQILIDGGVVPPSEYVVLTSPIGQSILERITVDYQEAHWPAHQNLLAPSTEPNTFEVTVESGQEIDLAARLAAGEIACDIFAALADAEHNLPDGVVSAIAYGLQMDFRRFSDPTEQLTMNLAGLTWTQRYLASMPTSKDAQILSPELDDGWSLWQR